VGEAEVEAEANAGIVQERRAGAGVILEEEEESMKVEEQLQERGMDQVVSSRSWRNAQTVHKRC